jgi:uncharacterized membrane protein YecN with MAPEG domain
MLRLEIAALYCGVNILLLLVLAYLVTRGRRTHKITLGDGGHEGMSRAIRAHANAAEYIPSALVGIVVLSLFEALPIWILHGAGISLTLGRLLHAYGLHTSVLNIFRVIGTALSWLAYLIIGLALIYVGLSHQLGA